MPCTRVMMRGSLHAVLFILLGLLSARLAHSLQAHGNAESIAECFKGQPCLTRPTTWRHLTEDLPSCLAAARVWWSAAPSRIPVTLITQLNMERLENLRAQCTLWGGPLGAVVYLPLFSTTGNELDAASQRELQQAVSLSEGLFKEAEATAVPNGGAPGSGCQLRIMLMYEVFDHPSGLNLLYPVNSLRNYARLLADTDLITNIDVDMLPSASISAALADAALLAEYTAGCRAGKVYVWPAFEARCGGVSFADGVANGRVAGVPEALKTCLRTMRPQAPFSHGATNFKRWLGLIEAKKENPSDSGSGIEDAYRVDYLSMFEPWFLSWRWGTPWYDFRYRGYGYNKIVQVAAMNASGTAFHVSPHGFLVHRPHKESLARLDFLDGKLGRKNASEVRGSMYEHVAMLWAAHQVEMRAGSYLPSVEAQFKACAESLPWWCARKSDCSVVSPEKNKIVS